MFMMPITISDDEYGVFIILCEDNLERMKKQDPVDRELSQLPDPFGKMRCTHITICYATDIEVEKIKKLADAQKLNELVSYLTRGYKFDSKLGDGSPIETLAKGHL